MFCCAMIVFFFFWWQAATDDLSIRKGSPDGKKCQVGHVACLSDTNLPLFVMMQVQLSS